LERYRLRFGVRAASEARRRFSGGALPSGTLSASRLPHFSLGNRPKPSQGYASHFLRILFLWLCNLDPSTCNFQRRISDAYVNLCKAMSTYVNHPPGGIQFPIAASGFMSKMVQAVAENQPTNKNRDER